MLKERRREGRPTKLTPERHEIIVTALRAGNYLEPSCYLAGINPKTAYEWFKRASAEDERLEKNSRARPKKAEAIFVEFRNAVKAAQADAEADGVAVVVKIEKGDDPGAALKAATWRLERKNPDRWGRRIRQEVVQDVTTHHFLAARPGGDPPRELSPDEAKEEAAVGRAQVNDFEIPPEPNVSS